VTIFSLSKNIPDRTECLIKGDSRVIVESVAKILGKMNSLGIKIIGIPCNTLFVTEIIQKIQKAILDMNINFEIVNMIDEVGLFIKTYFKAKKIGVLGTNGTVLSDVYTDILKSYNFEVIYPETIMQNKVHDAIYNLEYGIKSSSSFVSQKAKKIIRKSITHLITNKSEVVVLGCTELPLAVSEKIISNTPIIDSTMILARALVKKVSPEKLKPLNINDYGESNIYC
jgi:aspartate racemase